VVSAGDADLVAMARAFLWDPRWPWHAAVQLGGKVVAPPQYWRSVPKEVQKAFGEPKMGQR
jgi:2,4-dienoyl-CoA reductase-like NADH-dependent reductase (Old Yellow Enzyme family)